MSKEKPFHFSDNRRVITTEYGGEFLSVRFTEESEFVPGGVSLSRYCVPGRCDTYSFTWRGHEGGRVEYYSEGWAVALPDALAMLATDLQQNHVQAMIVEAVACPSRYRFDFVRFLLPCIAPKSALLTACEKALEEAKKEFNNRRQRRFEAIQREVADEAK